MYLYKSSAESCAADVCSVNCLSINGRQSQVKSNFIVVLLHVWTYSGTKCHVAEPRCYIPVPLLRDS